MRPGDNRARPGRCGGRLRSAAAAVAAVSVLAAGCRQVDEVRERFRDVSAYEAYAEGLEAAGLAATALGQDWVENGRRALDDPLDVDLPYQEEGFLSTDQARALGFRIELERGQRFSLDLTLEGPDSARVFMDLYRTDPEGRRDPMFVTAADSSAQGLAYAVGRGGTYVLRIQPELLRGGAYRITLRSDASLAFPVSGAGTGNIQSFFGADRDAGRRSHHGVDIFSPRGTPVVAGTAGYVSRVQVTGRGGKVVWLRDREQNQSLYYAHLDSQIVRQGTYVRPGEVLGLVGNSGNARTTPPHLHFGIYRRGEGPVDPLPFLRDQSGRVPPLTADREQVGAWVRAVVSGARLRQGPGVREPVVTELALHTPARVDAVTGDFYRVRLPDGRQGFLSSRAAEGAGTPIRETVPGGALPLRTLPAASSPVMERSRPGAPLPVLGTFGDYLLVQAVSGRTGWLLQAARTADQDGP